MSNIQKVQLDNGIRILTEPVDHVRSATVAIWCTTGSVDEADAEAGITHFIEHMLFKGTARRDAREIAAEIEGRGGVLNAMTDKEATCYYARVLSDDVIPALDVLTDMVTGSKFDAVELEREKEVVLEEIKRIEDEPDDLVHDLHLQYRWAAHRLGKPIIGTSESVARFTREEVTDYVSRHYRGPRIVVSATGRIDPEAIRDFVEGAFASLGHGEAKSHLERPSSTPGKVNVARDVEQVHFCIGGDGCSVYDDDLYTLAVLDGLLGSGMSSRLFQEVRERRGLAYAIGSYTSSYSSGGTFTVYGGTSMQKWEEVQEVVYGELAKVRTEAPGDEELEATKRQLKGHLVLALESMSSRMSRMTRNEIFHGREIPIDETLAKIDSVTAAGVTELAERVLAEQNLSQTAIGPFA
ncbi:MAG: M16 family metallopeptidase [Fimbriimonadaceae bacterium]